MPASTAIEQVDHGINGMTKPLPMGGTRTESNKQLWWLRISGPFIALMKRAGYDEAHQTKYVKFVQSNVLPFLGPPPGADELPHFDSFCNDDFSPVELSWNVHAGLSTVRIGFEPIGHSAGTKRDPFNELEPTIAISHLLQRDPRTNDALWRHFYEDFSVAPKEAAAVVANMAPNEHMSSNTISFDLVGDPLPKVYCYPIAVGLTKNQSRGELVSASLERLGVNIKPALGIIREYVAEAKSRHGIISMALECLSFDLMEHFQSRFKLYIRTPRTSLEATKEILTLGGRLDSDDTRACLATVASFWSLVLQTDNIDLELQRSDHRTAGIIFNFEIRHNDPIPHPKVYIPTRHYGGTDLKIAQGLSQLFRKLGWSKLANSYVEDLQVIFPSQDLRKTIGRQSYVGISHTKDGPYVTVYYNTMIFSIGAERNEDGKLIGPASKR